MEPSTAPGRATLRIAGVSSLVLALGTTAGALSFPVLGRSHARFQQSGAAPIALEELLSGAAAAVLLACTTWACLLALATVGEAVTGRTSTLVARCTPALLRRAVLAGCGAAITGASLTAPAFATPFDPDGLAASTPAARGPSLHGLALPDRTAEAPDVAVRRQALSSRPAHRAAPGGQVTVAPGDSLWSIGAGIAGPRASALEVDRAWRAVYRANRDVIGDDPDLLLPGTALVLPPPSDRHSSRPPTPREEAP